MAWILSIFIFFTSAFTNFVTNADDGIPADPSGKLNLHHFDRIGYQNFNPSMFFGIGVCIEYFSYRPKYVISLNRMIKLAIRKKYRSY